MKIEPMPEGTGALIARMAADDRKAASAKAIVESQAQQARCSVALGSASELRISGENARIIIVNCHALMRHKFRRTPLWSMVSQITGHGSGYSWEICKSANLDGGQNCGVERLKDFPPNKADMPTCSK